MPPFADELTQQERENVTAFIRLLSTDSERAHQYLNNLDNVVMNDSIGKYLFKSRCALCHGITGKGDGKMTKLLTMTPSPANLTTTPLDDAALMSIISIGGAGVNRSPKMPPWGDLFPKTQIKAIIKHIRSLKE